MRSVESENSQSDPLLKTAERIFIVYIFFLPIILPFNFKINGFQVLLIDIVFLLSLTVWALSVALGKASVRATKLYFFIGLFLGAMSLSTLLSIEPVRSLVKLAGVYYLAALAVLTFNLCSRRGYLRNVLITFVLGGVVTGFGTIAGVVGFYASWDVTRPLLSHFGSLPPGNYVRVRSFFENANMACNFLNLAVAAVVATVRAGWIRYLVGVMTAIIAGVSVVFTLSPGIGGVVLTLGAFGWATFATARPRTARLALFGSIACAGIVFLSTTISPSLIFGSWTHEGPKYSVRVQIWMNSIQRSTEFPIAGRGTGTNVAEVVYIAPSGRKQFLTDAHNAWLNILGQTGIVGLIAFSLLCWYLWSLCRFRVNDASPDSVVLVAASCGLLGAFFFQNLSGSFEDARHLWVWIGLIAAAHHRVLSAENVIGPGSAPSPL